MCAVGSQSVNLQPDSSCVGEILDLRLPLRNRVRVSLWDATHWSRASALHTLFDAAAVSCEGLRSVYTEMISCKRDVMTPVCILCQYRLRSSRC